MSQNALLERKPTQPAEQTEEKISAETIVTAQAQALRDHLTLVEWRETTRPIHTVAAPAPKPLRRRMVGVFDAAVLLLMLSSAAAGVFSLLHMG